MLKIIKFLLILNFFSSCITSNPPLLYLKEKGLDELAYKVDLKKIKRPYYWKVEYNGQTSYLLGTLHEGISSSQLPYIISNNLKLSEVAFFEVIDFRDLDLSNDQKNKFWKKIKYDGNLSKELSPKAWERLAGRLNAEQFDLVLSLPLGVVLKIYTYRSFYANFKSYGYMDNELLKLAKKSKVLLKAMDTNKGRFLYRMSNSYSDEISKLEKIFSDEDEERRYVTDSIKSYYEVFSEYKDGTMDDKNLPILSDFAKFSEEEYEFHIGIRNEIWIKRLLPDLKTKNCFIAGGVAHMMGKDSLILLLRKEGFKVSPVF